ncbi:unnamed protein product [Cyclocybe aegerita]|uniref:Reverse transcriptase n=1 Tax=Cyclocybe aegerita TaxID=1973307 RepID=A0A8S0VVP3_CYCAE|nr:unnamed protein product [Cyclocybe aegerita]
MAPNKEATVEHPVVKHCPVLTAGELSPKAAMELDNAFQDFFTACGRSKTIAEEEKVPLILSAFKDLHIRDWIASDRERLLGLTYDAFMKELRANYLPTDWIENVCNEILGNRQQKNEPFWAWTQKMKAVNILLRGTTSHFNDDQLRQQLEGLMDAELRKAAARKGINAKTTLKDWIEAVKNLDEEYAYDRKRYRDAFEEDQRSSKRVALSGNAGNTAPRSSSNKASTSTGRAQTGGKWKKLPKLEQSEKDLLEEYEGCWKCRQFFAYHGTRSCPNEFPPGNGYHTLTLSDVQKHPKYNAYMEKKGKAKTVAAVTDANESDDEDDAVAATMSSALGDGTDSEVEHGDSDVSPPFRSKHIVWRATLTGPRAEFPVKVSTLIDNGAHLVLIRPELVDSLGLERLKLPVPETVDVAIKSLKEKRKIELDEFVKITVTSLDGRWTSRTVHAIIAPGLYPLPPHKPKPLSLKQKRREFDKEVEKVKLIKKTTLAELCTVIRERITVPDEPSGELCAHAVAAVKERVEILANWETLLQKMQEHERLLKEEFLDVFKPIPHVDELPTEFLSEIHLKDATKNVKSRTYACPRKYKGSWQTLIKQHLDAGRIRPSSSRYASPAFIIPKADPTALPRWVNDYRDLNANTVKDSHPIPRQDDILADCLKGVFFAQIDMTNSFFQTPMHPDHIHLTAVTTPFGLYEWTVMPMGLRNAPAIHQRRVTHALRECIGRICHIYLDDIVIWSQTLEEHVRNVREVLSALRAAKLYINEKKSHLFCTEINFLGHKISAAGIEADGKKADKIANWPTPKSATEVRAFLGLVRYLSAFLPNLAEHTFILNKMTMKDCDKDFPPWTEKEQAAFDAIKAIVVSRDCLTSIDYAKMPDNKIFVMTDASETRLPTESTKSSTRAEREALGPWDVDPEDELCIVMERPLTSPCDMAEGLCGTSSICATKLAINADKDLLDAIRSRYKLDPWTEKLRSAKDGMNGIAEKDGLWFLAHDALGHFGFDKTYGSLRGSYYWPNMRKDLEEAYVPGCADCQRNKNTTKKPIGPLHPLPIPDARGDSVAIDFIGPLPEDDGKNCIISFTDRLGSDEPADASAEEKNAWDLIRKLETDTWEAQDNLLKAKISQSFFANKNRQLTFPFKVGDRVVLSTVHRRQEYKAPGKKRVAKFMPRYDGPYRITDVDEDHSTVTLNLPNSPNMFPVFHTSQVKPFTENDATLFPSREFEKPLPIVTENGEEYYIRDIIDERWHGRGWQYKVRWEGYAPEDKTWLPR